MNMPHKYAAHTLYDLWFLINVEHIFEFYRRICYHIIMGEENYYSERDKENNLKIRKILREELPRLCGEYFIGVQTRTTTLTRLGYAQDLCVFFDFLFTEVDEFAHCDKDNFTYADLDRVTATHIEVFMDYLSFYTYGGRNFSNSLKTKSRKLSTLKSFFKYYYNKDRITANPAAKVATPKIKDKPILRLDGNEVDELLDLVDSDTDVHESSKRLISFREHTRKRDLAILTLFLSTGIRISELVGLNIDDIDFKANAFKVTRKGGAQSILYFTEETATALGDYLDERAAQQLIEGYPALFLSLQKRRITVRAVENLVKKYASIVTPLKNITPHKLRSTFGTSLYNETSDIYVVAEILGHRDINTTKRHYAAISEQIKKDAAGKVRLRKDKKDE